MLHTAKWPLIGRDFELTQVLQRVHDPAGGVVIVSGAAGTGRSRLLAATAEAAAAAGCWVSSLSASRFSGRIPFAAFLQAFPELSSGRAAGALTRTAALVADRSAGQRPLMIIDDSEWLDDRSTALAFHLVVAHGLFLVVGLASGPSVRPGLATRWRDLVGARVYLGALGRAETEQLVAGVLGGPVHPALADRTWELSGGNPRVVVDLLRDAVHRRTVKTHTGRWCLQAPLGVPRTLVERVDDQLDRVPARVRGLVELVAYAEPVRARTADRMGFGPDVLAAAERRGLVTARQDTDGVQLHLTDRFFAETVRAGLLPLRRRALARRLCALQAGEPPADPLHLASWHLDAELPLPDQRAGEWFDAALRARDLQLGERLARRVLERPTGSRPEREQAAALLAQCGAAPRSLHVLPGTWSESHSPADRAPHADVRHADVRHADDVRHGDDARHGWSAEASERLVERMGALVRRAALADAEELALALLARSAEQTPWARGWAHVWLSVIALRRGWVDEARDRALAARSALVADADPLLRCVLTRVAALAAGQAGMPEQCHALLAEADAAAGQLSSPLGEELDVWCGSVRSWAAAASGDLAAAVRLALTDAEDAARRGQHAWALETLHQVVRYGAGTRATTARLRELAPLAEGTSAMVYVRHSEAGADPEALVEAASALEADGFRLCAAEAVARAAVSYRRQDRRREWTAAAARASALAAACPGAATPALRALVAPPRLTVREAEIATLAASGLTSAQIAQRLVVSVRTVDNTLGRVYGKLGVTRRADLGAHLVGGPGAPARPVASTGVATRVLIAPAPRAARPHVRG